MFDAVGTFAKTFTPIEGGYLYYPSAKSGGKFVSTDEFDTLLTDWQKVAGRRGFWKIVGISLLVICICTTASVALGLPSWMGTVCTMLLVPLILIWLLRAALSPRRLVRDRPDAAPPRSMGQARKEARSALNWRFIIFNLLFSGTVFFGQIFSKDRNISTWAWIIGSGVMLASYIWIGIRKLGDRTA